MDPSDSLLCVWAIISSVFCNQLPFSCEAEHTVSHHVPKRKLGHHFVTKTFEICAGFTKETAVDSYGQRSFQDLDHRSILGAPAMFSHCGSFQGPILLFFCHSDRISRWLCALFPPPPFRHQRNNMLWPILMICTEFLHSVIQVLLSEET